MSTTSSETIKCFCKLKQFFCEYASLNGYCKLTACAKRRVLYEGHGITVNVNDIHELGGDTE